MSHKRIVFDLDDTISYCQDRDFANAKPNTDLINKINKLYAEGWEIYIITARGQLSCNGDPIAAMKKYGAQIQLWLAQHEVKYHVLSFNKVLADFYVDDKAMTPEDFIKNEIEPIAGGLSGSEIYRVGNRVFKKDPNSYAVAQWYKEVKEHNLMSVPEVYSVVGDLMSLEWIDGDPLMNTEYAYKGIIENEVLPLIGKFVNTKWANQGEFAKYKDRVMQHLLNDTNVRKWAFRLESMLDDIHKVCDEQRSFCHGDLSMDNIMIPRGFGRQLMYIDPGVTTSVYSSWLLDCSKLIQSLQRKMLTTEDAAVERNRATQNSIYMFAVHNKIDPVLLDILVLTHWIRMLKYAKAKDNTLYQIAIDTVNATMKYYEAKLEHESTENQ